MSCSDEEANDFGEGGKYESDNIFQKEGTSFDESKPFQIVRHSFPSIL